MDARIPGRRHHVVVGNGGIPQGDVVAHASREEDHVLVHHRQRARQHFIGDLVPRTAIEQDLPGPRPVQAGDEAGHRRLPGPARTDHRDPLARPDRQVEILDEGWTPPVVAEGDAAQLHLAGQPQSSVQCGDGLRGGRSARRLRFFRGPRDVVEALHVYLDSLPLARELDEASDGRQEHGRHQVEPHQSSQGHLSGHDVGRSEREHHGVAEHHEQPRQGRVDVPELGESLAGGELAGLMPAPAGEVGVVRGGHPQVVGLVKHQHADSGQQSLLASQGMAPVGAGASDDVRQRRVQHRESQHHQREPRREDQHDGQENRARRELDEHAEKVLRHPGGDSVDGQDASRQLAHQPMAEVLDRQP